MEILGVFVFITVILSVWAHFKADITKADIERLERSVAQISSTRESNLTYDRAQRNKIESDYWRIKTELHILKSVLKYKDKYESRPDQAEPRLVYAEVTISDVVQWFNPETVKDVNFAIKKGEHGSEK